MPCLKTNYGTQLNQSNLMRVLFFYHHISKLMTNHNTTIKNFHSGIKYIRIRIFDVL